MPTAMEIAEKIAANGPLAIKITKELAWRGQHEHPDDFMRFVAASLALLHASEDGKQVEGHLPRNARLCSRTADR